MANGELDNNPPVQIWNPLRAWRRVASALGLWSLISKLFRPPIRNLLPDDLLLRALAKRKWLDDLHEAFILRSNETGLSVCFDCTPAECVANLKRSYGVASFLVRGVTALGLNVVPDEPQHALIEGLPHKEHNPGGAEWFASRLAEIATIVDQTRRP